MYGKTKMPGSPDDDGKYRFFYPSASGASIDTLVVSEYGYTAVVYPLIAPMVIQYDDLCQIVSIENNKSDLTNDQISVYVNDYIITKDNSAVQKITSNRD